MKLLILPRDYNGTVYAATDFNIKIENKGLTVYNAVPTNPVNTNITLYDNNNIAIGSNVNTAVDYQLYVDIPLINVWDSIDLTITISKTNYQTFTKEFRFYGLDVNLNIDMVTDTNQDLATPHAKFIPVYRPMTNLVHVYNTSNYILDSVVHKDVSGNVLANAADTTLTVEADIDLKSTIQATVDIAGVQTVVTALVENTITNNIYFLSNTTSVDCVTNCSTCISTISNNNVLSTLDTSLLTHLTVDGASKVDGIVDYYSSKAKVISYDGSTIFEDNDVASGIVGSLIKTFGQFTIPSVGDYIARTCWGLQGELALVTDGSIPVGFYKVLSARDVDFSNLTITGVVANGNIIEVTVGGVPTDWGSGVIAEVIDTNTLGTITEGYYRVWDATNIVYNGGAVTAGQIIYYSSSDALTIGATGHMLAVGTTYECCIDELIEGCDAYEVKQTACGGYTLYNRSASAITYTVSQLDSSKSTTWLEITSSQTLAALSSIEIAFTDDGVYKIDITASGTTTSKIVINSCALETCKLDYINKLLCCNPETNCDDKADSNCTEKNFYYFNAFKVLADSFYAILNNNYSLSESYTTISDEKIATLYEIDTILERVSDYCQDCEDCTKV